MIPVPPLWGQTPSQTIGPFFAMALAGSQYGYALASIAGPALVRPDAAIPGQRIRIEGLVLDGAGVAVSDALVEIWQADALGCYAIAPDPTVAFSGFGRCGTGTRKDGLFWFETIKPGSAASGHAPHVNVVVLMRGLLLHAFTRMYFDDEAAANAADPVLASLPSNRRATLLAQRSGDAAYRWDIHMQGDRETVFFDM